MEALDNESKIKDKSTDNQMTGVYRKNAECQNDKDDTQQEPIENRRKRWMERVMENLN